MGLAVVERQPEGGLGSALRRLVGRAALPDLMLQQMGCPVIALKA